MITGLTFGAFDLFHAGHLDLLKSAKKHCNRLVVCVSSNEVICKYKKHLPVIDENERVEIIKAIDCVDWVDVQTLDFGIKEAVQLYKPDVLFAGSDWKGSYKGEGLGVRVEYLPRIRNIGTSLIINKIKNEKIDKCFKNNCVDFRNLDSGNDRN